MEQIGGSSAQREPNNDDSTIYDGGKMNGL